MFALSHRSHPFPRLPRLDAGGFTLVEMFVALAFLAILTAIAIPHFDPRRMQIVSAQRLLLANLRVARTNAISKSVHYQVSLPTTTQIKVSRMLEPTPNSGSWSVDSTKVQTIRLPSITTITSTEVGTTIEFNSRGFVVNPTPGPQRLDVQDTYGQTKYVQVWPSGQINAP